MLAHLIVEIVCYKFTPIEHRKLYKFSLVNLSIEQGLQFYFFSRESLFFFVTSSFSFWTSRVLRF